MMRTGPVLQEAFRRVVVCPIHSHASHIVVIEKVQSPIGKETIVVSSSLYFEYFELEN